MAIDGDVDTAAARAANALGGARNTNVFVVGEPPFVNAVSRFTTARSAPAEHGLDGSEHARMRARSFAASAPSKWTSPPNASVTGDPPVAPACRGRSGLRCGRVVAADGADDRDGSDAATGERDDGDARRGRARYVLASRRESQRVERFRPPPECSTAAGRTRLPSIGQPLE